MSDRLSELRRQRALVEEHLAWLDREIAAAHPAPAVVSPQLGSTPAPVPATAVVVAALKASVAAPPAEPPPAVAAAAEAILDEYRRPPQAVHSDVKKGCFLYFFSALGLIAIGVIVLYFLLRQ